MQLKKRPILLYRLLCGPTKFGNLDQLFLTKKNSDQMGYLYLNLTMVNVSISLLHTIAL